MGVWTRIDDLLRSKNVLKHSLEMVWVIHSIMHDYASIKDWTMYEEHHLHGPREAEPLLQEHGYPRTTILAVKACIALHRGSTGAKQRTKEAICLASADAMAHIAQLPSLLYLAYVHTI